MGLVRGGVADISSPACILVTLGRSASTLVDAGQSDSGQADVALEAERWLEKAGAPCLQAAFAAGAAAGFAGGGFSGLSCRFDQEM